MAWKVFDLIVEGAITLKNKILDISNDGTLSFDGKTIPTFDGQDFNGRFLMSDGRTITPGDIAFSKKSGVVEKTLGPSGDFQTFDELSAWIDENVFAPNSWLRVSIESGTYDFVIEGDYLFSTSGRQLPIEIVGSGKDSTIIRVSRGQNSGYKAIFSSSAGQLIVSNLSTIDTDESQSLVHVNINGGIGRVHDLSMTGGMRAISCMYNSSILMWNIYTYNMNVFGNSVIYISSNANAISWYDMVIEQTNGVAVDAITASSNSSIQINYANISIKNSKNAIQAQYNGRIVFLSSSSISIEGTTEDDIDVTQNSRVVLDIEPITEEGRILSSSIPKNTLMNDGSIWTISNDGFSTENGLADYPDGTLELKNSVATNVLDRGEKSVLTKEAARLIIGLERIIDGKNSGWRFSGANPDYYGTIGNDAIDMSVSYDISSIFGATGDNAIAIGTGGGKRQEMVSSGVSSVAIGVACSASADYAIAIGDSNSASAVSTVVIGSDSASNYQFGHIIGSNCNIDTGLFASGVNVYLNSINAVGIGSNIISADAAPQAQVLLGAYNIGKDNTVLEVGNGSDKQQENVIEVYVDGSASLPVSTPSSVAGLGAKSITTIEFLLSEEFGNMLPTVDPGIAGKLWNNNGVLSISSGV